MRSSALILAALLLAGCSEFWDSGDLSEFTGLPPESYWVVTRTYPSTPTPGGEPRCAEREYTDAARLAYTAPGSVTLTSLRFVYDLDGYSVNGTVLPDGALHFDNTAFGHGVLPDSRRFVLNGSHNGCPVQVRAVRYSGPRACEVTTEEDEAAFVSQARAAVRASDLGLFRAFFANSPQTSWFYPLYATQPGEYAQSATNSSAPGGAGWSMITARADGTFTFVFDDGFVFTRDSKLLHFGLVHPSGVVLEGTKDENSIRLHLGAEWVLDFGPGGPGEYIATYLPTEIPLYMLTSYATPVGTLEKTETSMMLELEVQGQRLRIDSAADATTMHYAGMEKMLPAAERDAYCPVPGFAFFRAFPNLLEELGYCTTPPLYANVVLCEEFSR